MCILCKQLRLIWLFFFFLHGIYIMPCLCSRWTVGFISLPLSFRCYCTLSNRLREQQQQQSTYAKHTPVYYTARGNGNTLSNLWYMQMSLQLRLLLLHTSVKGGREENFGVFFFFFSQGGRRYIWSRNCVKSYCTSTHWQKWRVDFLPTSGDTHTQREREREREKVSCCFASAGGEICWWGLSSWKRPAGDFVLITCVTYSHVHGRWVIWR